MKKNMKNNFNPNEIELKWQAIWDKEKIYQTDLGSAKRPFYNLMMFPYPSAEGLHIGGVRTFGGVDIYGRFKRMQGHDVFEPFGLDGFGIHAENYALKIGVNPVDNAKVTEKNFYRQIKEAGIGVDWSRTVETYKPEYYKWTQWLFVELFKAGLAYRKKSPVNFCPSCKTVLADEQVIDGKCERCSSIVEKKNLEQWFFRITDYAERLLTNIEGLDWTAKVKIAQRNWIGKKEGIEISYEIEGSDKKVTVFTTRPDTNFGATFIALAPEHSLVQEILNRVQDDKKAEIKNYVEATKKKTEIDRQSEGREKTGVFTGFYAINSLTGYKMPVWISDFVLIGFGTGAVVGVPGHDTRDFEFAQKFGLNIIRVVVGKDGDSSTITKIEQVQEEAGSMVNSDFLNGLDIHKATDKIMDYIEEKGYGRRKVTYHLRDWLISRQRYWGPPIPMVYCGNCAKKGISWFDTDEAKKQSKGMGISNDKSQISNKQKIGNSSEAMSGWFPVSDKELPVKLPYIEDFKPIGTGASPLGNHPEFYEVTCPECGAAAKRETDVSDTFLDSSWYFLRYLATDRDDMPFPSKALISENSENSASQKIRASDSQKSRISESSESSGIVNRLRFLPVTMYIGGAEHSVLHLLYARFITMFIKDLGLISFEEPFSKFFAHGLIIKDGAKMSKSKGNVVGPDLYIKKFGADTLRMYLHFLAPFSQEGDFRDSGIEGMNRFLKKVWKLFSDVQESKSEKAQISSEGLKMMHETIKNVTVEMENLRFNTSIAHLMSYYNFLAKQESVSRGEAEAYLKMLAPFAPYMTEELWQELQSQIEQKRKRANFASIHTQPWPEFDEQFIVSDTVTIPVQVNGKLRSTLSIASDQVGDKEAIEKMAKNDEKVAVFIKGKSIKKFIYIPGKVVNFVI